MSDNGRNDEKKLNVASVIYLHYQDMYKNRVIYKLLSTGASHQV
jgi:hypothetical protein